ncbi:hypothetical protein [Sphingomonas sp. TREG-RG-20F-R18-01]|uniref:hypothetical protein n=1 Tax=Sphingomonas sp. TREG-RG-20F-R18-01 TaxID=2914982 RepID=UPI001F5A6DFE|nr:hypothetical protein [Sphingomonas sp. TREG-RG-20F-R18-01]
MIAEDLQARRVRQGWSAHQLARRTMLVAAEMGEEMSLTQQAVSQFENKKLKSVPRWVQFAETALDVVGLSPDERRALLIKRFGRFEAQTPTGAAHLEDGDEREIVKYFSRISPANRAAILQLVRCLAVGVDTTVHPSSGRADRMSKKEGR